MANIPGGVVLPGAYSESEVVSAGGGVTTGNRVLCIIGEGARREVLVNSAAGNGDDGLDSTYTTTLSGTNGRRFKVSRYPLVSNRMSLLKNGIPLVGKEETISATPLASIYDYRVEITTGKIELQGSALEDQGGSYYVAGTSNVGAGVINSLTLIDDSALAETWTIRCSSVRRDSFGDPIDGYAKFVVSGSVSGILLDGYGSPVVWQSDNVLRNNGVLEFSIEEGLTAFDVGDYFTIKVKSGVLKAGDSLIANYISELDLNDPEFFTDIDEVQAKHGVASATNTLTLGCQLAFANGAPGIMCLQAAPGIPRRVSYSVVDTATGNSTVDDLKFPLPINVVPSTDTDVKFFVIDAVTRAETQILPNKVDFYNPTYTASPSSFITGADPYSYTVVLGTQAKRVGEDGEISATSGTGPYYATFESDSFTFDLTDRTATTSLNIFGATNVDNNGTFTITAVNNGKLTISSSSAFTAESNLTFRLLDTADQSAYVLMTEDLALSAGDGLRVSVIDIKDASFYDPNWTTALEQLETQEVDMVAPLPLQTKSAIIQSTMQHCLAMSRIKNRKERVLLTGAIQGLLPNNVIGTTLAAVEDIGVLEGIQGDDPLEILAGNVEDLTNYGVQSAFGTTYRCIYFYPDRIVVSVNGTNTYFDGFYIAAAAGGWLAGVGNVSTPLTEKTLAGFSILKDRTYKVSTSKRLVNAGIALVEPVQGGGRVVWGKTTTTSAAAEEQELSITFIRDRLSKQTRLGTRSFVGQPVNDTFATSLETAITSVIKGAIGEGIITSYRDLTVKRDATEPRQWNIKFAVLPVYPANWIYIKFTVGI